MRDFRLLKCRNGVSYGLLLSDFVKFAFLSLGEVRLFIVQNEVRKLLVLDFDRAHGITRCRLVNRSYSNNICPSPEDFALGSVVWAMNDVDGLYAGHLLGGRAVDAFYARVSVWALDAIAVQHVGTNNVIGVLGAS